MSTEQSRNGIDELTEIFRHFKNEISTMTSLRDASLRSLLIARVVQAIDDGMPALESESSRGSPAFTAETWAEDGLLIHALEQELNRHENVTLRWLVVAYWVVLCDFDAICANLEPLVVSNLDELTWLVACSLWVYWGSGQPTTHQLRTALVRIRAQSSQFDVHLKSALENPHDDIRESAIIVDRLLTDPSATLPMPNAPGKRPE